MEEIDDSVPIFDETPGKEHMRVISDCYRIGGRQTYCHMTRGEAQSLTEDYLRIIVEIDMAGTSKGDAEVSKIRDFATWRIEEYVKAGAITEERVGLLLDRIRIGIERGARVGPTSDEPDDKSAEGTSGS